MSHSFAAAGRHAIGLERVLQVDAGIVGAAAQNPHFGGAARGRAHAAGQIHVQDLDLENLVCRQQALPQALQVRRQRLQVRVLVHLVLPASM